MNTSDKYFLLLSDQTVIVGKEFEIMKVWRRKYRHKPIIDMFQTKKRVNSGVTSLSKLIDYDPENPVGDYYRGNDIHFEHPLR